MTGSLQIPELAHRIVEFIKQEKMPLGTRLPERKLAAHFRVSRSPIAKALRLLEEHQIVRPSDTGGFLVHSSTARVTPDDLGVAIQSDDEVLYLKLAEDHTARRLPVRASENELMRRYGTRRSLLTRVLHRAANEGWAERLPGRGWGFLQLFSPQHTYEQVCRYRIIVEPAAILEPTFQLDRPAVEAALLAQIDLFERGGHGFSPVEVFEIGSQFHQVILRCSRNPFLMNGIDQTYRMRRLTEYTKIFDTPTWLERCREHARIAELLLNDERQAASEALRHHLEKGAAEKCLAPRTQIDR